LTLEGESTGCQGKFSRPGAKFYAKTGNLGPFFPVFFPVLKNNPPQTQSQRPRAALDQSPISLYVKNMTGWDVLNNVVNGFPFVVTALFLIAALVALIIFIAGFARHGVDFIKHGFKQNLLNELTAKLATKEDINRLNAKLDSEIGGLGTGLGSEIGGLRTELETIKVNHFGHLKNYLGVLNGVLLDKNIIDNEIKARLDNELRGM
jgi:hypothetical protein